MAERLPIYEIECDIIARLKTDRRLILSAPTGSGKSTQVPHGCSPSASHQSWA